jgi:hypothetical protein
MIRPHHTLFTRKTMESQETTKCLRRNHWLMPPLEDAPHTALHREISTVPLLDPHTAMRVHQYFEPVEGDYIASLYSLMRTIEASIRHPRAGGIEKGLGNLAVFALEEQLPFIRAGLVLDKR